jgi:hypothetical protein
MIKLKDILIERKLKPEDVKIIHKQTNHYKLSNTDGFNNLKIGNNISDNKNHYKGGKSNKIDGTVEDNSIQFDFDSRVADGSDVTNVALEFTNTLKKKEITFYEVKLNVTYKNSGVRSISSARTNITISNLPDGLYQLTNNIDDNNWLSFTVNK